MPKGIYPRKPKQTRAERNAYLQKWREANREKDREGSKRYRERHPDRRKATARRYVERNREKHAEATRAWREANPEKVRAMERKYREANPTASARAQRRWREANPDWNRRWKKANASAVRRYANTRRAREAEVFIEEVNPDVVYEMHGGRCGICGEFIAEDFHVDHVVPIARGGQHGYVNVQPAHPFCNQSKGAKLKAS